MHSRDLTLTYTTVYTDELSVLLIDIPGNNVTFCISLLSYNLQHCESLGFSTSYCSCL